MTNDSTPKKSSLSADEIHLHQIDDKIFRATMQNKEALTTLHDKTFNRI